MGFDYDEDIREILQESLDRALEGLTPTQRARIAKDPDLEERLSRATAEALERATVGIVERLRRDMPTMVRHRHRTQHRFEERLAEHWSQAFDAYEAVVKVAFEVGEFTTRSTCRRTGNGRTRSRS